MVDCLFFREVWTLFLLLTSRLCSSKLGHPVMINDEDVDAEKPSINGLSKEDQEQFFEPDNLIANIKLAQISGQITNGTSIQVNVDSRNISNPKTRSRRKTSLRAKCPPSPQQSSFMGNNSPRNTPLRLPKHSHRSKTSSRHNPPRIQSSSTSFSLDLP